MKSTIGPLTAPKTRRKKRSGSAIVSDLEVKCGSMAAAEHLDARFYHNSRTGRTKAGVTVTGYRSRIEQRGPYDFRWIASYVHTCVNEGAARSDAIRAIQQAGKSPKDYRYKFIRGEFSWKPSDQER